MYLLNANTLQLEEFNDDDRPQYTILSHRWQSEEVSFHDIKNDTANTKKGFWKVRMACKRTLWDGLSHTWIDTCCIDKSSSAELSEAINSMYRWYAQAERCYAYLYDVSSPDPGEETVFHHSVWFERSWTLQELIAPRYVYFYDRNWLEFGTKQSLHRELETITKVPLLQVHHQGLEHFSVAQRMTWAARRKATRKEDVAYSLMGIFDVNMPLLYGEGDKAFMRLQEEIIKRSTDRSILLWNSPESCPSLHHTFLAKSPFEFISDVDWESLYIDPLDDAFLITSAGMDIKVKLHWHGVNDYSAVLCETSKTRFYMILRLQLVGTIRQTMMFVRLGAYISEWVPTSMEARSEQINIVRYPKTLPLRTFNGFFIEDCRQDSPFDNDFKIVSLTTNNAGFEPHQTCPRSDEAWEWTCTVEVAVERVGTAEKTSVNFRLGFDFWSRPVCLFGTPAILNVSTIPDIFKTGEKVEEGTRFLDGTDSRDFVLIASPQEGSIVKMNSPDYQLEFEITSTEHERKWVFRIKTG